MGVEDLLAALTRAVEANTAATLKLAAALEARAPKPAAAPAPEEPATTPRPSTPLEHFRAQLAAVVDQAGAVDLWQRALPKLTGADNQTAWTALVAHFQAITRRTDGDQVLRLAVAAKASPAKPAPKAPAARAR